MPALLHVRTMTNPIKITNFNIKPNKPAVLRALGCAEGSAAYERMSAEFDGLRKAVEYMLEPLAFARFDGGRAYCLLTVGGAAEEYSKTLFDKGEALGGLIVSAIADEYLFEMDSVLGGRVKAECAKIGMGVKKRLEAPADMKLENQRVILDKIGDCGVTLTDGFMFNPAKSMGYILELTNDSRVFNAQHDCSKCDIADCPRRSAPINGNFAALSGHGYKAEAKSEENIVCIDIGTTTLAFQLVSGGVITASHTELNAQRRFGLDVLSRIDAANRGRGREMAQIIRYQLISGVKKIAGGRKIDRIIIAANTTMVYLLMGYDCRELGAFPFKAEHTETIKIDFGELTGSDIAAETTIIGGISAFVGGDITSGIYMCDMDKSEGISLFIDLGTNGETAIGNREKITATSAAAGPAFEGGKISCGVGSVDGAVCGVDLKSGEIRTINSKPPVGICGTGMIELLSELKDAKIMDETGLLTGEYFKNGYKLAKNVIFTQSDIRELQTAKSAIRAGIGILAAERGGMDKIKTVYLAGGFGYNIDVKKACNIGLLPPELENKVKAAGNSALGGAVKYALEGGNERIEHIRGISGEITLGKDERFNELYLKYMGF